MRLHQLRIWDTDGIQKGLTDGTCDDVDDDCDGNLDEDVNLCCCDEFITQCATAGCAPGYVDANHSTADGGEYACTPSKRTGPSDPTTLVYCNTTDPECGTGIDNACNGVVDEGCWVQIPFCSAALEIRGDWGGEGPAASRHRRVVCGRDGGRKSALRTKSGCKERRKRSERERLDERAPRNKKN